MKHTTLECPQCKTTQWFVKHQLTFTNLCAQVSYCDRKTFLSYIIAIIVCLSGCIKEEILVINSTSASIEIPHNLREDRSLQLIWSKQDTSQCVCPPFEQLISQCACNVDSPSINTITISNSTLTVSNLAQEMSKKEVTLHFVSSVSSGCHFNCNLRSLVKIYRISFTQGKPSTSHLCVLYT